MYNFLNLGWEGYRKIAIKDLRNARMLSRALEKTYFKVRFRNLYMLGLAFRRFLGHHWRALLPQCPKRAFEILRSSSFPFFFSFNILIQSLNDV